MNDKEVLKKKKQYTESINCSMSDHKIDVKILF